VKQHTYQVQVDWTGNNGDGTKSYTSYRRDHTIVAEGKSPIPGSSDPGFRGDRNRYNPEELLVASLSACHMLWYLHLCADAGIVVTEYHDDATGAMAETDDGGGHFTQVSLRPVVKVAGQVDPELARRLHERAHHLCFIANSVNFPVLCEPSLEFE